MGAEELIVKWGNLERFFEEVDQVGAQAGDVEAYAKEQVFNKSGFDYRLSALQPLADVMDTLGGVFGELRGIFDDRWVDLIAALAMAGRDVKDADSRSESAYLKTYADLGGQ